MASGESTPRVVWNWFVTIQLWLTLILAIAVGSTGMVYWLVFAIFCYFISESIASTCCYLLHPTTGGDIYSFMQTMFYTPCHIEMHIQCYHFETRYIQDRDAQGNIRTRTQEERVNTHSASERFYYISWRDISGRFVLDTGGAMNNEKLAFVKLHLNLGMDFANDGTQMDYERQKDSFKWRNNRDTHMDYTEAKVMEGFIEHNLVRVSDFNPPYFGLAWYILAMCLTVVEFYKMYVDKFCITQEFTVKKIVSSKMDLNNPQNVVQYQQFFPCIVYLGQVKMYDKVTVMPTLALPSYEINLNMPPQKIVIPNVQVQMPNVSMTMPNVSMQVTGGPTMQMNTGVNMQMNTGPTMQMNAGPTMQMNTGGMQVSANMPGFTVTTTTSPLLGQ